MSLFEEQKRRNIVRVGIACAVVGSFCVSCTLADYGRTGASAAESKLMLRRTLQHDGIEREYFVHIPGSQSGSSAPKPLVMAIHGYTSTATGFQEYHGLNRHADEHGYMMVYPQGSHFMTGDERSGRYRVTSWNDLAGNKPPSIAGPHCTDDSVNYPCPPDCSSCNRCAWTSCYDDAGFLEKVLDSVQREFNTDTRRSYLLGVSNGGMMAQRLACRLDDRFAAVAPIISQLAPGYDCAPAKDMPMIHLFGGMDDTVRFDGKPASDGYIYTSAADMASNWAQSMACADGPHPWISDIASQAELQCTAYSQCNTPEHEVVSCMDVTGAHRWPSQGIDGTTATCVTREQFESMPDQAHCEPATGKYTGVGMDLVLDFFLRYTLRPSPH